MAKRKKTVLTFSAHAADAIDLAGGALAKYALSGHEVILATLSLGAKTHAMRKTGLEQLRAIKRTELERACKHLGILDVRSLEYEEDPLVIGREQITEMVNLIREIRPEIVISHHPNGDVVPDHSETGRAVWHACHCSGRPGFDSALPLNRGKRLFFRAWYL